MEEPIKLDYYKAHYLDLISEEELILYLSKNLISKNVIDHYLGMFILSFNLRRANLLIAYNADLNKDLLCGHTALNLAVRQRYTKMITILLKSSSQIDFYKSNNNGLNPLELSCANMDDDIFELLLPYYDIKKLNLKKIDKYLSKNNISNDNISEIQHYKIEKIKKLIKEAKKKSLKEAKNKS